MRALVTGGAGFIGSHVVRGLLARGAEVVVLDRALTGKCLDADILSRVTTVEADACDPAVVTAAAAGCDRIFAFAALVGVEHYSHNPVETMRVEERALEAACAAALAVGCPKVLYPSSSAVYGNIAGELSENQDVSPVSNYAVAKRYNELFLRSQYEQNGLQSVALRIFNVYGPLQDERLVIPRFVRRALSGEPLVIFGTGSQRRDFIYVGDVVEATLRCSDQVTGYEIVNVSTGRSDSVLDVAHTVIRLTGGASAVSFEPVPATRTGFEVESSQGSTAKLQRLTGFRPATGLEAGLAEVVGASRHG